MENLEDKPNGWSWRVILARNKLETILVNESGGGGGGGNYRKQSWRVILESNPAG